MPNLPRRLREDLEATRIYMKRAGYKREDSRWLEEHSELCPVCLQPGLPAALGALALPEADMTYVPYVICQQCAPYCNPRGADYQPERLKTVREHILTQYPDLRSDVPPFLDTLPEDVQEAVMATMTQAAMAGMVVNVSWIQQHPHECIYCGKVDAENLPRAFFQLNADDVRVAYYFWACPSCDDDPDRLIERLTEQRQIQPAPPSSPGNVVPLRRRKGRG